MSIISTIKTGWAMAKAFGIKNAPLILTVTAAVNVVGVGITAWRGALRAREIVKIETEKKGSSLTKSEAIKKTWKAWVPPLTLTVLSVCSMGAAWYIHSTRLAEATAAAAMLMTQNKQLEGTINMLEEKAPDLVDEVTEVHTKHHVEQNYDEGRIYDTGLGDWLYYDEFRDFMFRTDPGSVSRAIIGYQQYYKRHGIANLNKLYSLEKVPECGAGDIFGYRRVMDVDDYEVPNIVVRTISGGYKDEDLHVIYYSPTTFMDSPFLDEYYDDDDDESKFRSFVKWDGRACV